MTTACQGSLARWRPKIRPWILLASAIAGAAAAPQEAGAEWIREMLDARCSVESKDAVSTAVRSAIETSVRRSEASIEPPIPVGDLSCLSSLMAAPLDKFSNVGEILGDLQLGLDQKAIGDGISRGICSFAQSKWNELTEPLDKKISSLESAAKDFTKNFGVYNLPTEAQTSSAGLGGRSSQYTGADSPAGHHGSGISIPPGAHGPSAPAPQNQRSQREIRESEGRADRLSPVPQAPSGVGQWPAPSSGEDPNASVNDIWNRIMGIQGDEK